MMTSLVLIAHDQLAESGSQQFLIESGRSLVEVEYVDLYDQWKNKGDFDSDQEIDRILSYDQLFLQFPIYWYQAPFILKLWLDQVFSQDKLNRRLHQRLQGHPLGIITVAGSQSDDYQFYGRQKITLSSMLAPYYAWANYFDLKTFSPFSIFQYHYLTESERLELMIDYSLYLNEGKVHDFKARQEYIIKLVNNLKLDLSDVDQWLFDQFLEKLNEQKEELHFFEEMEW